MPIRHGVTAPQKADRAIHLHFEAGCTWRGLAGQSTNEGSGVRAASHRGTPPCANARRDVDGLPVLAANFISVNTIIPSVLIGQEASHEC